MRLYSTGFAGRSQNALAPPLDSFWVLPGGGTQIQRTSTAICIVGQMDKLFEIDQKAREQGLSREGRHALRLEKALQPELSNSCAKNAIRPVALGRKNWIHIGSKEAGPRLA